MGKRKDQMKKNTQEFLASTRDVLGTGGSVRVSLLSLTWDGACAKCSALGIDAGGEVKLKRCSKCNLVYYCSRECQQLDWKQHKALCRDKQGQVHTSEAGVLSVPQMMMQGSRILVDEEGSRITLSNCQIQPDITLSLPKPPLSVLRVNVSSADRSTSFAVNALFSMAAQASSISERLAAKLGLTKSQDICVSSLRAVSLPAGLPSAHVDVACSDIVCPSGDATLLQSLRVAFVILPDPGNEMVLGEDWFEQLKDRADRHAVLDYAPDQCRLRLLPAGEEVRGQAELFQFAQVTELDQGDFIAARWGRPDPGPSYNPDPAAADFSHHVRPDHLARAALKRIAAGDV